VSLLSELRRRNVYRIAVAYAVAAWPIIQVVETIFPAFGFDDATTRYTRIALMIGIVPAVIFAWTFEGSPQGLRRDRGVDQAYFSDGITEEILNLLTCVPELRDVSRSSSFAYRDKNLSARDIADALNVNYILEGSIRKQDDQLRITAQLIDALTDSHLWSNTQRISMTSRSGCPCWQWLISTWAIGAPRTVRLALSTAGSPIHSL
jgi:hypothetical protein